MRRARWFAQSLWNLRPPWAKIKLMPFSKGGETPPVKNWKRKLTVMEWNYRFYGKLLYVHYKECKGRTVHPTDTSSRDWHDGSWMTERVELVSSQPICFLWVSWVVCTNIFFANKGRLFILLFTETTNNVSLTTHSKASIMQKQNKKQKNGGCLFA